MMNTKICKGCNLELLLSRFNKHKETKDGLRSKCIECRRLEHIEYRNKNPEKMRQIQKECDLRKISTPELLEKKRVRNRLYSSTENGKLKARLRSIRYSKSKKYTRKYTSSLNTKQRLLKCKYTRVWRSNNKDRANALYALRRASKKNATPPWLTRYDKDKIIELYTICQMFKTYTGQEYHVDHIVPLINENVCGLHIPCNLRVISAYDNLIKSNRFDESIGIDYSATAYC